MRDPTRGGVAHGPDRARAHRPPGDRDRRGGAADPPRGARRLRAPRHRPALIANEGKLVAVVAPEAEAQPWRLFATRRLGGLGGHRGRGPPRSARPGSARDLLRRHSGRRHARRGPSAEDLLSDGGCHPSSAPGAAPRSATSNTSTSRSTRRLPSRRGRKGRSRRRFLSGSRRCSQASHSPASARVASGSTTWSPTGRQ